MQLQPSIGTYIAVLLLFGVLQQNILLEVNSILLNLNCKG